MVTMTSRLVLLTLIATSFPLFGIHKKEQQKKKNIVSHVVKQQMVRQQKKGGSYTSLQVFKNSDQVLYHNCADIFLP